MSVKVLKSELAYLVGNRVEERQGVDRSNKGETRKGRGPSLSRMLCHAMPSIYSLSLPIGVLDLPGGPVQHISRIAKAKV